jgi:integrase
MAADHFLEARKGNISERTWRTEADRLKPLRAFLGDKRLSKVADHDIETYQNQRKAAGRHPRTINHEVKLLLHLLRRAKLPALEVELFDVGGPPKGRVLEPDQKLRLFQTASSRPEWQTAYCAALLTANASLRPCEIRGLRWQDINVGERTVAILRSKTEAGEREVPLNAEAWSAISAMKMRAESLSNDAPEHYIFHRLWPKMDATRPMSSWRTAWRSLRKAAGFPRLRYYNLRHQCVTEMLEAGVPEGVIREVVGHVDPAMTRWYSDVRRAARRAAVETLSAPKNGASQGGYGTNHGTKALPGVVPPQLTH